MNNNSTKTTASNNLKKVLGSNQTNNSGSQNKQLILLIVALIIIVLLWVAGNYIYKYYKSNQKTKVIKSTILTTPHNGQSEYDIGNSELATSSYSNEYSISFWVYVDDYSYRQGQPKFIMRRGSIATGVNPEVYLDPSVNTLRVNISMTGNNKLTESGGPEAPTTTTSAATTTSTTTSTTAAAGFMNISKEGFQNATTTSPTGDLTFNADSAAAPGLINNPMSVLSGINSNDAMSPAVYDDSFFSMISGNKVGSIPMSGVDYKHNDELNVVLEQFTDPVTTPAATNCECENPEADDDATARAAFEEKAGKCMVTSFPLQKWVHVVISQYNQVVDIYVDGKLSSSCILPSFPDVVRDDLIISPNDGFSGKITKVVYMNSAVSADDAYSMYKDGPDHYENILARVPYWAWGVLALIIVAIIIYSF